jgi:hypothetical protein
MTIAWLRRILISYVRVKILETGIDFFEEVYEPKPYDPLIDELDDEFDEET